MKKILLLFSLFVTLNLFAQNVGVNSTGANPDNSAMLDVQSASKGLLIPRVSLTSLTDAATITSPATSLLIYNTNAALTGGTGFYYNAGTSGVPQWIKLITSSEAMWREMTTYVEPIPNKEVYIPNDVGIGISSPSERLQVADGNIKVGDAVWASGNDRMIKFGDADYVRLGEAAEDDVMQLFAKYFMFKPSGSYLGNVGIGTTAAPTAKLEVNGNVKITDGTQGAGKLLTSDANGNATWTSPTASTCFRAKNFSAQSFIPYNTPTQLTTTLEDFDPNLNFFSSAFTAPATGVYHFDAKADISISAPNNANYSYLFLKLYRNGASVEENKYRITTNSITHNQTLTLNTNLYLTAGDVITLYYLGSASAGSGPADFDNVIFSGFRVH